MVELLYDLQPQNVVHSSVVPLVDEGEGHL